MEMVENLQKAKKEKKVEDTWEKMTPERMEYLKQFLDPTGKNFGKITAAGRSVGWNEGKSQNEHKKLLPIIQDKLETQGINLDYIVVKLKDGLESHYTEFAKFQGEIVDSQEVVDYGTRLKYLDRVIRLLKLTDKDSDNSRVTTVNLIVNNINRPKDADCNKIEEAEYEVEKST